MKVRAQPQGQLIKGNTRCNRRTRGVDVGSLVAGAMATLGGYGASFAVASIVVLGVTAISLRTGRRRPALEPSAA